MCLCICTHKKKKYILAYMEGKGLGSSPHGAHVLTIQLKAIIFSLMNYSKDFNLLFSMLINSSRKIQLCNWIGIINIVYTTSSSCIDYITSKSADTLITLVVNLRMYWLHYCSKSVDQQHQRQLCKSDFFFHFIFFLNNLFYLIFETFNLQLYFLHISITAGKISSSYIKINSYEL